MSLNLYCLVVSSNEYSRILLCFFLFNALIYNRPKPDIPEQ